MHSISQSVRYLSHTAISLRRNIFFQTELNVSNVATRVERRLFASAILRLFKSGKSHSMNGLARNEFYAAVHTLHVSVNVSFVAFALS
jgi:hypothetical protein